MSASALFLIDVARVAFFLIGVTVVAMALLWAIREALITAYAVADYHANRAFAFAQAKRKRLAR